MRNSIYLCLLVVLLGVIVVVLPMTAVGKDIMLAVAALTLVLAWMGEYAERNNGQFPNRRLIQGVALTGLVFSIVAAILSLLWAAKVMQMGHGNAIYETEASFMAVTCLLSSVWVIFYDAAWSDCRKQGQKPNEIDHK